MSEPDPDLLSPELRNVLARVRVRAVRRAAWLARLAASRRGETELPGGATWDDPAAERTFWSGPEVAAARQAIEEADTRSGGRLARLAEIFELEAAELDLVSACLAALLDPEIPLLATGRPFFTERDVIRLFGYGPQPLLHADSPLVRWRLIDADSFSAGESPAIALSAVIHGWLVGGNYLDERLAAVARLIPAPAPLPSWPVDDALSLIRGRLDRGVAVRVSVVGPAGAGRRSFAAYVASRVGLSAIAIDADAIDDADWTEVYRRAQRHAFLDHSALLWHGSSLPRRRWPDLVTPFPLQFVATDLADDVGPAAGVVDARIALPMPGSAEREALWRELVPAARDWTGAELSTLARRHRVWCGDVASASLRGVATAEQAAAVVRESSRGRLGELGQWVECPFVADDLIVSDELRGVLDDFTFEAEQRCTFWEEAGPRRLFPQGRGLFVLFTGPPGTGKTMAAQVIARTLDVDLFRISLAAVVSKYIGETAKNLERVLSRAEAMDAVLLFDEADALFSRRTEVRDAHDRYANTDTNHLLQAIEAYAGVAVLATNKKANLDPAFSRRLRYVLEFPRPDAGQRRRLWARVVAELAGDGRARALAGKLDELASTIEMTGAQIKFAVLAAIFAARRDGVELGPSHLLRGIERELLKDARALDARHRERIVKEVG